MGEHQVCHEEYQTQAYKVPLVTAPLTVQCSLAYPAPKEVCVTKDITITEVKCENKIENKCFNFAKFVDAANTVDQKEIIIGEPSCEQITLTLDTQACRQQHHAVVAHAVPVVHHAAHHAVHHAAPVHHAVHHAAPAYGHPAPAYGHHAAYAYEAPKHNCSVQDVVEAAEVCTPAFETVCAPVELPINKIIDVEQCYDVTRTVCSQITEVEDPKMMSATVPNAPPIIKSIPVRRSTLTR